MSAIERLGLTQPASGAAARTANQEQTASAFGYKWGRRDSYESPATRQMISNWFIERYCGGDPGTLDQMFSGAGKIILDAGCGSAHGTALVLAKYLSHHDYLGIDISSAVEVARKRFAEMGLPGEFLQADLMTLPVPGASVDIIVADGVLHHTDSTAGAIRHLAVKLKPGGLFLFYVYARKAVIREFTDDYIRHAISKLSDEQAWEALKPLTELGIALGKLDAEIEVPVDIPVLGIRKGRVNVQRLFYWNVCKAFYRPDFTFDEMLHVNFDWFRPLNCHRHTDEEVREFCAAAGLSIERMTVEESGISVVARRN